MSWITNELKFEKSQLWLLFEKGQEMWKECEEERRGDKEMERIIIIIEGNQLNKCCL